MEIELPPKPELPSHSWTATAAFAAGFAWLGGIGGAVLLFAGLAAHEAAHVLLARVHRVPVYKSGMSFKGPFIVRDRAQKHLAEVSIALAGPAMSLAFGAVLLLFPQRACHWAGICNLIVGLSNLLPLPGSDGLRAFRALRQNYRETSPEMRASVLRLTADL